MALVTSPAPNARIARIEGETGESAPEEGQGPQRQSGSHSVSPDLTTLVDSPDESLQEDQYGHIHGGSSEFAFLHLAKQKLARLPSMSILFSDYPLIAPENLPPILPPKNIADALLSNYFRFGLSTCRFVHEPSLASMLETMYLGNRGGKLGGDEAALVCMVTCYCNGSNVG